MSEIETGCIDIPVFPKRAIAEIAEDLPSIKHALIICHVNPDGDTVGSAHALRLLIMACGGKADVTCSNDIPKRLRFLCEGEGVETTSETPVIYDRIIAVDVASPMQLGDKDEYLAHIDYMIDHHGTGDPFAPYYIDPTASAAGEIIYALYKELKRQGVIGNVPEAARRIYAAIVSDTGSFKFSNTTPETHHIAAELVWEINNANDGGLDTSDVCRSLFGQRTLKELTAQMLSIQNLRFYENGRLGAVLFTQQMLADSGLTEEEIGNIVETPRGVEGVLVGISLRQTAANPKAYKVSSRSNAEIDVAAVCASFGGGGHVRAAGCTIIAETPEEALGIATEAFGTAVREYHGRGM